MRAVPPLEYADVPDEVMQRLRAIAASLPESVVIGDDTDWDEVAELVTESSECSRPRSSPRSSTQDHDSGDCPRRLPPR